MHTIRKIMKEKGGETWTTSPDALVYDALQQMADRDVGALLVMKGDQLIGIFSERDYARKVILKGKSSKKTHVSEIMTTEMVFVSPDQTCDQGLALMTANHVRYLPVFDGPQMKGIVSIGDLVKAIIADQRQMIEHLENYIREYTSIT